MTSWQTRFNRWLVYVLCWTINIQPVLANVVVNGTQTQVTQALNGVEVVDIAKPNGKGLSHNQYEMFNVDPTGLILNNSTQALSQSQLAGIVEGNANLQGQAASVILNEVTGSNRSQLNGYTEVLGKQANVILANPYGITCDGCGFMNTPRVTLSTGTPQIINGSLNGFDVSQGSISIEGLGLDGSQQTYFDIITRAAKLSADIHAQNLNVVTGRNQVGYKTNHVTKSQSQPQTQPELAIDSSALGGMYAGRIQLVSTESGVGVNAGNLAASNGDIQLSADGKITLGHASATHDIVLETSDQLALSGQQYAGETFDANAKRIEIIDGAVAARKELNLNAKQDIQLSQSYLTSGLDSKGTLAGPSQLNITADSLNLNQSQVTSSGGVTSQASNIELDAQSELQAKQIQFDSTSSLLNDGQIHAEQNVTFSGDNYHIEGEGNLSAEQLSLKGGVAEINSQLQGATITSAVESLEVGEQGHLNASQALELGAQSLINQGVLQSADAFALSVTDLDNQGSLIAAHDLQITAANNVTNSGLVYSAEDTKLNVAGDVVNEQGDMLIGGNFVSQGITDSERSRGFYNRSGNIEAQGDIQLNADAIENTRVKAEETTTSISNSAPSQISKKLTLKSQTCETRGGNEANEYCTSTYYGFSEKRIMSQDSTIVTIEGDASQLKSGGHLDIEAGVLRNNASLMTSNGDIAINADEVSNKAFQTAKNTVYANYSSGESRIKTVKVKRVIKTESEQGELYNASIIANGDISINATDSVDNGTTQANAAGSGIELPGAPQVSLPAEQSDTPFISDNDIAFPNYTIPESPNGLFVPSRDPQSQYVIETNPLLTDMGEFVGSDYFLSKIEYHPDNDVKFLGDSYYDTRTITQAIFEQTGQRYLEANIGSDLAQMQSLMDAAASAQTELDLQAGVALTPEQIANLENDIIWYERVTVNGQEVLAPKLYLSSATQQSIAQGGALIAGNNVAIAANTITNQDGTLFAAQSMNLQASDSILNKKGAIEAGGDLSLTAGNDIKNISGQISGEDVSLTAQNGSIINRTQVETLSVSGNGQLSTKANPSRSADVMTGVGNTASISSRGELDLTAGENIELVAANVESLGDANLNAGGSVTVSSARQQITNHTIEGRSQIDTHSVSNLASSLSSGGNLMVNAAENIDVTGSNFAALGNLALKAQGDITLDTAVDEQYQSVNEHRHDSISQTKTHQGASLRGDSIAIEAGNNVAITSADLQATNEASINAGGDVSLLAANDSIYHYDKKTKKKSFGRKKTTIKESIKETAQGTQINAGNINIAAGGNQQSQGDLTLVGADLSANDSVNLSADGDVVLAAQGYRDYQRKETIKKGFGGLTGKTTGSIDDATLLDSANVITGADVSIQSGNDIGVIASNISAGGQVDLEAENQVVVGADYAQQSSQQWSEESSLFSGGDIYSMNSHREGVTSSTAQGSQIQSGGHLAVNGAEVSVVGSELAANGSAELSSEAGDIKVLAATNHTSSYSNDEQMSIGFGDVANAANFASLAMGNFTGLLGSLDDLKDGRLSMQIAEATYDKVDTQTQSTSHTGASISANNNVSLNSHGDITVEGSQLAADRDNDNQGDLSLTSVGDVSIKEAKDTYQTKTDETHGNASVNFTVKHQAVETYNASVALKDSVKALKEAKDSYQEYKDQLKDLEKTYAQLEQDYNNQVPGVAAEDLDELSNLIAASKADESWYIAGIAMATEDVTTKGVLLAKQVHTSMDSTVTQGFNASLDIDMSVSKNSTSSSGTTSVASNLSGQNVSINSGNETGDEITVQGSKVSATDTIALSSNNINLLASQDKAQTQNTGLSGSASISLSAHGAATGADINASLNRSGSQSSSTTYSNSSLSSNTIQLASQQDTSILGANLKADSQLTADVGGNLNVVSQQNQNTSTHHSEGVSGGASTSISDQTSVNGLNGGFNLANGTSTSRETVTTSLISKGSADINVGGSTDVQGATIATINEQGDDLGALSLVTNTLTYSDLSNTRYQSDQSANVSRNIGKDKEGHFDLLGGSSHLQYNNESNYKKTKSLATIGAGDIQATGTENEQLASLNRDISQVDKDLYDVTRQQGDFDFEVDHRFFSEMGRNEISEDVMVTDMIRESIALAMMTDRVGFSDIASETGKQLKVYNGLKAKIASDPELAAALKDPNLSADDKKIMLDKVSHVVMTELGYKTEGYENKIIAKKDDKNPGFHSDETGDAYINDEKADDTKKLTQIAGHETSHEMDEQDIANGGKQYSKADKETYADHIGSNVGDYLEVGLGINGGGSLASSNNHVDNESSEVIENNKEYDGLDKNKGNHFLGAAAMFETGQAAVTAQTQAALSAQVTGASAISNAGQNNTTKPLITNRVIDDVKENTGNIYSNIKELIFGGIEFEPEYSDEERDFLAQQYNQLLIDYKSGDTGQDRIASYEYMQQSQFSPEVIARAEVLRSKRTISGSINPSTLLPIQEGDDPSTTSEIASSIDASTQTVSTNEQGLGTTESPSYSGVDPLVIVNSKNVKNDGSSDSDFDKVPGGSDVTKSTGKPDFIVSPNGTTMPTNKDFNLVDSNKKGGDWFQIHNKHTDAKVNGSPHTHYPEQHGRSRTREIKTTDGSDLDYADNALRNGTMRERKNRGDKGG
ncbi:hemagglutinin repeat-containing protein [Vibrio sp. AK197]